MLKFSIDFGSSVYSYVHRSRLLDNVKAWLCTRSGVSGCVLRPHSLWVLTVCADHTNEQTVGVLEARKRVNVKILAALTRANL